MKDSGLAVKSVVTCAEMKRLEEAADSAGLSYKQMMENAGQTAFDFIIDKAGTKPVCVFCGKGNNGGDGYVIARKFNEAGAKVRIIAVGGRPRTDDAISNYNLIRDTLPWMEITVETRPEDLKSEEDDETIVDAIFGTGFHGEPDETAAAAFHYINACHDAGSKVFAVDIPSGLSGDESGDADVNLAVTADYTIAFHAEKPMHVSKAFGIVRYMGEVFVADIGIGKALLKQTAEK